MHVRYARVFQGKNKPIKEKNESSTDTPTHKIVILEVLMLIDSYSFFFCSSFFALPQTGETGIG